MGSKKLFWLIAIGVIVKSLLAGFIELNNDEVYYWTYAQQLQWNYFDHPPGIAILLKIFTVNLHFPQVFFLRMGPIICGALNTWLIYKIAEKIKNAQAGWIATLLFTASPYSSLIAGFLVIPDAPQLLFWLISIWLMLQILGVGAVLDNGNSAKLLFLGLTIGCSILCKVHAVFLWVGFLGYIILQKRKLLRNPYLYASGLITAILISPIFLWSLSNKNSGFNYHYNRVHFFTQFQPDSFFRELLGEALYNNPFFYVALVITILALLKQQRFIVPAARMLLMLIAFPLILLVILISIFNDTLPHWTGPAYTSLIPLVAARISTVNEQSRLPITVKWGLGLLLGLLLIAIGSIKGLPYNFGEKDGAHLGAGDPTLDMNGFSFLGEKFDSIYHSDLGKGTMKKDAFLLSDYWFPAAHIDYYVAHKVPLPFIALGDLPAIHHYAWLNPQRPFLQKGDDAYFIAISNYFKAPAKTLLSQFGSSIPADTITQFRAGVAVRNFLIYRLKNYAGNLSRDGFMKPE
jgi:hypothetical protein